MASQLSYCHSSNRLTTKPFLNIVFSGFNGQLKERMDTVMKAHYNVWTRTEWRPEDVSEMMHGNASKEEGGVNNPFPGQTYVYLTADTDNELETLREDETYIIGGIVDKNRYKASRCSLFRYSIRYQMLMQNLASLPRRISVETRQTDWESRPLAYLSEPTLKRCLLVKS
jgi:hypothetical protein